MSAPWAGRRQAIGTFVKIPALEVVELLAVAGLDFIVVDVEHGAFDVRTLSTMIAVARANDLQIFVRPAGHAPRDVQPALDAGANGLFIPHVDNPHIAQAVVHSCRFPPIGLRGGSLFTRTGGWGRVDTADYIARGNQDVTIVAQIESRQAADAADQIGAVAGIDAVFIGPFDLALSSGLQPGGDELRDLIRGTERRCATAGITTGGMVDATASAAQLLARGLDFVMASNDASLLAGAAQELVEQARAQSTGAESDRSTVLGGGV